jgi:hypothetical protein
MQTLPGFGESPWRRRAGGKTVAVHTDESDRLTACPAAYRAVSIADLFDIPAHGLPFTISGFEIWENTPIDGGP